MAASSSDMSNVVLFSLDMDGAVLSSALANLIFKYTCTSLVFKEIYDSLPEALRAALSLAPQDLPVKKDEQYESREIKTILTQAREATVGLLFNEASKNLSEETKLALKEATKKALEEAHTKLIEHILHCIPDNAIAYFISGSNRQTRKRDNDNGTDHRTGSSFIALQALVDIITEKLEGRAKAFLDKTLLEDLANKQIPGTCFDLALQHGCMPDSEEVKSYNANTVFDANKLVLLYMQMQHVASQHDDSRIAFHFYDDDTDPALEKQILAPQILFFGHQVKEAIEIFLDNCINEIIFNIKVTEYWMQEYLKSEVSSVFESTKGTLFESLVRFKEHMVKHIMLLKNDIQLFQPTHKQTEDDLRKTLLQFRENQNLAVAELNSKLNELKAAEASVSRAYASAYRVCPTDVVIKISKLLQIFLHENVSGLNDITLSEKAHDPDVEIILNTLKQAQNPLNDKLPANVTLHLHKYVGPKKLFFPEAEPEEVLLTHISPIQGTGSFDPHYTYSYYWLSRELINTSFDNATAQDQPSLCRKKLEIWHTSTTTKKSLPNEEPRSSGETQLPTSTKEHSGIGLRRLKHAITRSGSSIFRGGHSHKKADSSKETHGHQRKP